MDAREARKYVLNNPPTDILAERRPSLLGRLFRRSSSLSESDAGTIVTPGVTNMTSGPTIILNSQQGQPRRDSISEAVQAQFGTSPPQHQTQQVKPNPIIDHEFGIYT